MASHPVPPPGSSADGSVVDHALLGALAGSGLGGFGAGVIGAFFGAVGAHFFPAYSVGALAGGSAGVALACLLLQGVFLERLTLRAALSSLLAGAVVAAAVSWWIESRFEWKFLRWGLAGVVVGTFGGALHGPLFLASGGKSPQGNPLTRGRQAVFVSFALALAGMIKWVNRAAAGALVAGVTGGALGGLFPAVLAATAAGEADLQELMGSAVVLPIAGAVLGAVGGGCGAWLAWRLRGWTRPGNEAPGASARRANGICP